MDGKTVFYVTTDEGLMCFDALCRVVWTNQDECPGTFYATSLSADGTHLYAAEDGGDLLCFDARTGRLLWGFAGMLVMPGTPAVGPAKDVYIVDLVEGVLRRLRDMDDSARVEWSFPLGRYPATATMVALGPSGTVYCASTPEMEGSCALYALDTAGHLLWIDSTHLSYTLDNATPVIDSRGRVIVGDEDGYLYCFNADGTLAWSTWAGYFYTGGITIGYDDMVYVQTEEGNVHCYDANGAERWSTSGPGEAGYNNVCAVSDSSILVYSYDDILFTIKPDGEIGWVYSIWDSLAERGVTRKQRRDEGDECPSPVVSPEGVIYIFGLDFFGAFVWSGRRTAATAWPTYNHDPARSGWAGRPWQ